MRIVDGVAVNLIFAGYDGAASFCGWSLARPSWERCAEAGVRYLGG